MVTSVNIDKLIEGVIAQNNQNSAYFNTEDGTLVILTEDEMELAKVHTPVGEVPEREQEHYLTAERVLNSETWILLPQLGNGKCTEILVNFLQGNNISDIPATNDKLALLEYVRQNNMESNWKSFFNDYLRKLCIEWCTTNKIEYQ